MPYNNVVFNLKPHNPVQYMMDLSWVGVSGELAPNRAKCLLWVIISLLMFSLSLGGCGSYDWIGISAC
jgi:hypothetical protein